MQPRSAESQFETQYVFAARATVSRGTTAKIVRHQNCGTKEKNTLRLDASGCAACKASFRSSRSTEKFPFWSRDRSNLPWCVPAHPRNLRPPTLARPLTTSSLLSDQPPCLRPTNNSVSTLPCPLRTRGMTAFPLGTAANPIASATTPCDRLRQIHTRARSRPPLRTLQKRLRLLAVLLLQFPDRFPV